MERMFSSMFVRRGLPARGTGSKESSEKHLASVHSRRYGQKTRHRSQTLRLSDQTPLNPASKIHNSIQ